VKVNAALQSVPWSTSFLSIASDDGCAVRCSGIFELEP
jgi:hypothetical protein